MIERKCFTCNVKMKEETTSITTKWGDYKLTIEGVKAYVCPECNEKIYSYDETRMIQELSKNLSAIKKEEQPDVLNVSEVADLLRTSKQTIYNMIRDERLKPVKIGREWRFMRQDIESILKDRASIAARKKA